MTIASPSINTPNDNRYRWLIQEFLSVLLVVVLVIAAVTAVTLHAVLTHIDQVLHLSFAVEMFNEGNLTTPHFLHQALLIMVYILTGQTSWGFSTLLANLLPQLFLGTLLYAMLRTSVHQAVWAQRHLWGARFLSIGLAVSLVIMTPATVLFGIVSPFLQDANEFNSMLLGFVTPTTFHNPTMTILRPFTLILFLLITKFVLQPGLRDASRGRVLLVITLTALATILCGLAKPNYLLAVLPAVVLWLAWSWFRKLFGGWTNAIFGVLVPGGLFLVWQFLFTYVASTAVLGSSSIAFAPFEVIFGLVGGSTGLVIARLIASVSLPVLIYALYWRRARQDHALNFAWLTFVIGMSYMLLLAETGGRKFHGNFFWSGYITFFIVNIVSVRFALVQWLGDVAVNKRALTGRTILILSLFLLILVNSIIYMVQFYQWG